MQITHVPLTSHGTIQPWGFLVHTTGDGPPKRALQNNSTPLAEAAKWYSSNDSGPHFLIGTEGEIVQFRPCKTRAWHAGVSEANERRHYLSGDWVDYTKVHVPPLGSGTRWADVVAWWRLRWPTRKSPSHLYPSRSPNDDYVGVELVPCGTYTNGGWKAYWGEPAMPGLRHTMSQYVSCAALANAVAEFCEFPAGWHNTPRLVGHEDVNPLTRPGWDPGDMRRQYSWSLQKSLLLALSGSGLKLQLQVG